VSTTAFDTTTERDGALLLALLRLIGWTIEIEHEGPEWVGVAHRLDASGEQLRVGATAESHGALVWQLFRGSLSSLELRDEARRSTLRAA